MKVMIVDDSIVYRSAIGQALKDVSGIEVVKTASNGKIALDFLRTNPSIELMTLDMEMPEMDGITTIKEIRKFNRKLIIIVFSSLTIRGAEKTLEALSCGANDFVAKVEGIGTISENVELIKNELLPKINGFRGVSTSESSPLGEAKGCPLIADKPRAPMMTINETKAPIPLDYKNELLIRPNLVCIGASTGGPDALQKIFCKIQNRPNIPILLVQHMPPIFTKKLAAALDKVTELTVKEAQDAEILLPSTVYIAPGDFHMRIQKSSNQYSLKLDQTQKVCHVRPSVDVLFDSVAQNFEGKVATFVLTGMGSDGCQGVLSLASKKASIYIQDKESSAVWGMPGSVYSKYKEAKVLKLEDIGLFLNDIFAHLK